MFVRIGIILLNYNNSKDTLNAIRSISQSIGSNSHALVVVDNNSTDNSVELINGFIKENYLLHTHEISDYIPNKIKSIPTIYFLPLQQNNGYAAGNNAGIKFLLNDITITHFWILNNDVEIHANCIQNLENGLQKNSNRDAGIFGTLLINFFDRTKLQALGGFYNPYLAKTTLILPNAVVNNLTEKQIVQSEKKTNYFIGASIILTKELILKVGLLNENYFLYSEEIDICLRAKKVGLTKKMIYDAIVYHKEGGTTGKFQKKLNLFVEHHNIRSKIIFTKLYYKKFYLFVLFLLTIHYTVLFKGNMFIALKLIRNAKK